MISFALKAENSSGIQHLIIDYNEEEKDFSFTLCGNHKGEAIQIDFDPLTADEMDDLVSVIEARIKKAKS